MTTTTVPTCRSCGVELALRPDDRLTKEQRHAGDWWDHPPLSGVPRQYGLTGHTVSHLDPSEDLRALYPALYPPEAHPC